MITRYLSLGAGVAAAQLLLAPPAPAIDGVVQINQARAIAGGVTPGDSPGFPITLSLPGSYRLTGNLDVTGLPTPENETAISITGPGVEIDLNGFSILGPTVCSGSPVSSCSPVGTGRGVSSPAYGVHLENGAISGFGANAVFIASGRIDRLFAFSNGGIGLWVGGDGMITDSASVANGGDGMYGVDLAVRGSRALENGGRGIAAEAGEVRDCEAVHNTIGGISVGIGLAAQNVSRGNGGCAIAATGGGYARNATSGGATLCGGVQLEANLCNGAICP